MYLHLWKTWLLLSIVLIVTVWVIVWMVVMTTLGFCVSCFGSRLRFGRRDLFVPSTGLRDQFKSVLQRLGDASLNLCQWRIVYWLHSKYGLWMFIVNKTVLLTARGILPTPLLSGIASGFASGFASRFASTLLSPSSRSTKQVSCWYVGATPC